MSDKSHGTVPREGDVHHGGPGAPSMAQPGRDEGRRQGTLSRRPHLPGRAVRRHRRGLRPAGASRASIQHILPRRDAPSTAAPGARPQSARHRGCPPASSRAAPPQAESTHRPVRRASRRRAAPPASQPGPKSSRKSTKRPWHGQPGDVGVFSFSGDGEKSAAPSPGGGPGGESSVSVPPLVQGPAVPTFSKKEQFPFPPGSQVHGTTVCDALPPHSRKRPILPVAKRVRFGDDIPPHAPLASPVRDPGSSVRMPQNAPPSVPSTPTPFRCTTTGTSIVPLEPLAQHLEAWLTLPSLSRWLTRTIQLGYAIQFARRPPKFNGVLETSVAVRNAPVLREEIAVLLAKDAIEPVPPAEMRQGFYSPYFIVPKKGGGLRPILDLRVLNRALHKLPFKMLTHRRMIKCIQPQDWFAAIDLKDAYVHVSILPRHRPFLWFAFEGRAWQYRVLPFGLSLSPRVFTKVVEGALTPLREVGVRILNYLDDWLILAQSREQLGDHRDLVLRHLSQLGLRVNWEKSKLSPVQRISFLGVELDSWVWRHASRRNVPKQCWTAWVPSEAGMWYHWNSFRGSWGIWNPQLQSRRSDCFIWDHFSTDYTPGSRGGHGAAVHCE